MNHPVDVVNPKRKILIAISALAMEPIPDSNAVSVGAEVIRQLYPLTGIKAYHMSGKVVTDSAMQFRKEGVNMGLPTFSEYEIWRTDIENVRAAKKVLEEL